MRKSYSVRLNVVLTITKIEICPLSRNGNEQIVFYQSGVGSEANFKGDQVIGTTAMRTSLTAMSPLIGD